MLPFVLLRIVEAETSIASASKNRQDFYVSEVVHMYVHIDICTDCYIGDSFATEDRKQS